MLSFSRQFDINYLQGDPSRLGHHQGPREQYPDGLYNVDFEVPDGDLVNLDLLDL